MAPNYVKNAKARKALKRIRLGNPRPGDDARINRLAEAYHARTEPKFAKERKRKQYGHPLRDEHGAITFVGKPYELIGVKPSSREFVIEGGSDHGERFYTVRRIWLAGISAQRGF